jgi:hypothetical protein
MPSWIDTDPPGDWAVENTPTLKHWGIYNKRTGRRKKIGPVYQPRSRSKVNYFDRAMEEATRRNQQLAIPTT